MDARLQTAVSEGLVNSIISVHKFEDLMVPKFCWLLFLLHVSYRITPRSTAALPRKQIFVRQSVRPNFIKYLEKHVWCSSFYLGLQDFKPEVLCCNNLLGLALELIKHEEVISAFNLNLYLNLRHGRPITSLSYFEYSFSNSLPQQSANPGASLGQNKDHCPLLWTLFMNKSGIQRA